MAKTAEFPRQFMVDILDGANDGVEIVSDTLSSHGRWSVGHTLVFKHDGTFYKTTYRVGATESQDESPWEYEDEVECVVVRPVEKTVVVYEAVEDGE